MTLQPPLAFHYKFTRENSATQEFTIRLDRKTLTVIPHERRDHPDWTRLSNHQCPNCPLKEETHPQCPIARNLVEVIDFFKDSISHEPVKVEIQTEARGYVKETSLQAGVSSLVGIYMVTSGCPVMDQLKPMVRTHLPFATNEETLYRTLSMYLLAQYFRLRKGEKPDWDFKELMKLYEGVRMVNQSFCRRLSVTQIQDAVLNAVIHLDCFADFTSYSLEEAGLDALECLFDVYLK